MSLNRYPTKYEMAAAIPPKSAVSIPEIAQWRSVKRDFMAPTENKAISVATTVAIKVCSSVIGRIGLNMYTISGTRPIARKDKNVAVAPFLGFIFS